MSGRKLFHYENENTYRVERILFQPLPLQDRDLNSFQTIPSPLINNQSKYPSGCIVSSKDGIFKKKSKSAVKKQTSFNFAKQSQNTESKSYRDAFQTVRSVNINNMHISEVHEETEILANRKEMLNSQIESINQRLNTQSDPIEQKNDNSLALKQLTEERDRLNDEIKQLDVKLSRFKPVKREIYKQKQDFVDDRENFELKWKMLENDLEYDQIYIIQPQLNVEITEERDDQCYEIQSEQIDKQVIDNLMLEVEELMSINNIPKNLESINFNEKKNYEPLLEIIEEEPSMEISFLQ